MCNESGAGSGNTRSLLIKVETEAQEVEWVVH